MKQCNLRLVLALITGLLVSTPALAASDAVIDKRACQNLVKHTPNADVAYHAGVDVRGKAVAPADLPGTNTFKLQDSFDIPLTVGLADRLNLKHNKLGKNTDIQIGTLTLKGDKVYYNGQPLSNEQQDNLEVLCLERK